MPQTSAGLALKRTSSESDIVMSPKRIKPLTPIVDKVSKKMPQTSTGHKAFYLLHPRAFFWRTQRFTLKRTSSASDVHTISPKRKIKLLTRIVDKEFVDGTPDKFLEEAGLFRDSSPREAASKLWLGAVYSVKILFIRYRINILTHDALKIFCDIAVNSSKIFAKSKLVHAWAYAKKLYSYSVDESRCLSKETYDTYMDEVIQFIKTFKTFKNFNFEAIEKFLDEFFCKPTCTEKKSERTCHCDGRREIHIQHYIGEGFL
uniref:Uncharacterized protein n=1 Tax=Meloidogyne incognita TaxID=6306 RepID=A0A914N1G0_MELIC